MPTVIDWSPIVDPSELVRQTRDTLASGSAVVLPGDCGYAALWRPGTAIDLPAPALLAWGPDEAAALGANIPTVARRLMVRAWSAPLVIEAPTTAELPANTKGFARFRYPEHSLFDLVIPAVAELGPILVADTGDTTATAAAERLKQAVGLVVDAGARAADTRPTVVRATDTGYTITEAGAFPTEEIERLAARIILFVCTGNTCRSPLAEGLAKKLLADRLGCTVSELPARGFWVLSAGVATYGGSRAAVEACEVAAEYGADLNAHASRPVNAQLLLAADDVIAMTQGHLHAIRARYPDAGPVPRLLCDTEDLDDPIGAGPAVYRECAETIFRHLERILPEWVVS